MSVTGTREVLGNLDDWAKRMQSESVALAQSWAGTLEAKAKSDAPWTDRTSHARNGLFGTVEEKENEILLHLSHTMEYGVFLELANEGRFAILQPTIDAHAAEIHKDFQDLWAP